MTSWLLAESESLGWVVGGGWADVFVSGAFPFRTNTLGTLWKPDTQPYLTVSIPIPPLSSYANSHPTSINDNGAVVGYCDGGAKLETPFLFQNNAATPIPIAFGRANCINNDGDIVGYSLSPDGSRHGFIDHAGAVTLLDSLVPKDSQITIENAVGINKTGSILCTGYLNGAFETFLMTPVVG